MTHMALSFEFVYVTQKISCSVKNLVKRTSIDCLSANYTKWNFIDVRIDDGRKWTGRRKKTTWKKREKGRISRSKSIDLWVLLVFIIPTRESDWLQINAKWVLKSTSKKGNQERELWAFDWNMIDSPRHSFLNWFFEVQQDEIEEINTMLKTLEIMIMVFWWLRIEWP